MMRRMRDYRSYTVDPDELALEPQASNYYPITSGTSLQKKSLLVDKLIFFFLAMYIRNSANDTHLSVLTDRSQGGGSIKDDQVQ